ncbi:MAG: 2Fe-2S iron-sulfur cluster-binding protein [Candidatus Kryptonium sp.]
MPLIDFYRLGIEVKCKEGETIFKVARENSIPIAESCNGDKTCGRCRVLVLWGMENLSSPDFEEMKLVEKKSLSRSEMLACAAKVYGNVKITTSYW